MRIGLFSIGVILALFFLILINNSQVTEKELNEIVDKSFEQVDQNVFAPLGQKSDNKINIFIVYTIRGLSHELHGSYYLISWINEFLPNWILDNLTLILILVVLSILSPLIWYSFLIIVFIITVIYEKWKEWNVKGDLK